MHNLSVWIVIRRLRIPFLVIIITFSVAILGMMLIPGQDDQGNVYYLNFFDAFYFVSYMASTIGFGESPYAFTYQQKLWVSFTVYMTVIGWFYGIGTIVALMQDKVLHNEIAKGKFAKTVASIREPFVLIFGYNEAIRPLIRKFSQSNMQMVIIDRDEAAIEALMLENFSPYIPAYTGNILDPSVLELAGIGEKNCQFAISLLDNDQKNTKIALMCRHLNRHVKLVIRSNSLQNSRFLETMDVCYIENPFRTISHRLYLSLRAPHIWLLEMWMYGHIDRLKMREKIPDECFIIYGYGRMGKALEQGLKKAGVRYSFIDARVKPGEAYCPDSLLSSEEVIEKKLLEAGVENASVIIAATGDDFINLAVVTLARKNNPKIYTATRENELGDAVLFKKARINRHYLLESIIINKTYNSLAMPLTHIFIEHIGKQNEAWGEGLVSRIVGEMGKEPKISEICISHDEAHAVCRFLEAGIEVTLEILKKKRENHQEKNEILFLLVRRGKEVILLPSDDFKILIGDEILLAYHPDVKNDLGYILENYYELHYVLYGKEQQPGILGWLSSQPSHT